MGILSGIGGIIGLIAIIGLTIFLWTTFHNLVTRIYFGGLSNMIMTIIMELFVCGMISVWIVSMVGGLIVLALQGVGSVLMFVIRIVLTLLKIAAIIAAVGGGIYGIYKLVIRGKSAAGAGQGTASTEASAESSTKTSTETAAPPVQDMGAESQSSAAMQAQVNTASQNVPIGEKPEQPLSGCDAIIKSNVRYYQKKFRQIDESKKGGMNWASFFLGIAHAGYRGMTREWLRELRVPLIMAAVAAVLALLAIFGVPAALIAAWVLLVIAEIVLFVMQIRFSLRFNQLYKAHVEAKLQNGNLTPDPSVGKGILASLLYGAATGIIVAAVVAGSFASLMSGFDDYDSDLSYEYDDTTFGDDAFLGDAQINETGFDYSFDDAQPTQPAAVSGTEQRTQAAVQQNIPLIGVDDIFAADSSQYVSWGPNDSGYYMIPYQDETGYTILFTVENSTINAYQAYYMNVDSVMQTEDGGLSVMGDVMTASRTEPVWNGYFEVLWNSYEEIDYPYVSAKDGDEYTDLGIEGDYSYYGYVDDSVSDTGYGNAKADGYYLSDTVSAALYDPDGYLIPYVDSEYIDADMYSIFDKSVIRLMINEIYARHGRSFQTADLNEYFSSKNWYMPMYSAEEFDDSALNGYEKENIRLLAEIRDSKN